MRLHVLCCRPAWAAGAAQGGSARSHWWCTTGAEHMVFALWLHAGSVHVVAGLTAVYHAGVFSTS
jgi:hypothetical protein